MTDRGSRYTLDEELVAIGFVKYQGWINVYADLGSIAEAMEVMILSFIGPSVRSEWNLSSTRENLITIVVFTLYMLLSIDISYCNKGNWCWGSKLCG